MHYLEKLKAAQEQNNSWLCVGLDPRPDKLPIQALKWDEPVLPFNRAIIEATADLVCAYKANIGFYLQWGAAGIIALERTIAFIPNHIPVILDCKTGERGDGRAAWAAGLYDQWGVDAVTVYGATSEEGVYPMIGQRPDKAVYLLKGDLPAEAVGRSQTGPAQGHVGVMFEDGSPQALAETRRLAPRANFLVAGIGDRGADLKGVIEHGPDAAAGPVINTGREVIYASAQTNFAEAARAAVLSWRDQINTTGRL